MRESDKLSSILESIMDKNTSESAKVLIENLERKTKTSFLYNDVPGHVKEEIFKEAYEKLAAQANKEYDEARNKTNPDKAEVNKAFAKKTAYERAVNEKDKRDSATGRRMSAIHGDEAKRAEKVWNEDSTYLDPAGNLMSQVPSDLDTREAHDLDEVDELKKEANEDEASEVEYISSENELNEDNDEYISYYDQMNLDDEENDKITHISTEDYEEKLYGDEEEFEAETVEEPLSKAVLDDVVEDDEDLDGLFEEFEFTDPLDDLIESVLNEAKAKKVSSGYINRKDPDTTLDQVASKFNKTSFLVSLLWGVPIFYTTLTSVGQKSVKDVDRKELEVYKKLVDENPELNKLYNDIKTELYKPEVDKKKIRLDSKEFKSKLISARKELKSLSEETDVEYEVKHEGILEVPEGKKVSSLPYEHFEKLVDKKGYAKVIRALNNLSVWNKNSDPKLSAWAKNTMSKLKAKFRPEDKE